MLGWIILGLLLLPVIIYLIRLVAGLIAFGLGAFSLVLLFTGNIIPGIVLLVIALILGIFAPEPDPDLDYYDY